MICGNGYDETGWIKYRLDTKGIPEKLEVYIEGRNQPENQSIGTYNATSNLVCFLKRQNISVYTPDGMQEVDSTIRLFPGVSRIEDKPKNDDGAVINENYSYNILIYTGIPKAEFALLNILQKEVELYNRKTGLMTQKTQVTCRHRTLGWV